jgi:hypothetical protein
LIPKYFASLKNGFDNKNCYQKSEKQVEKNKRGERRMKQRKERE